MNIVVTGASGFLGSYFSRWLLERDYRVSAVSRGGHSSYPTGAAIGEVPKLPTAAELQGAFTGASSVVHLAGRVHVMRDTTSSAIHSYRAANVELTRAALHAAAAAGCGTFVLASSVKAVGESNHEPWTEETPAEPIDPYGVSKLEAEQVVATEGARLGIRTIILRFPLVYGPGMRANMLRLFRAVDRGLPLPLGAIQNRRSLLFVGNAAAALELAATHSGGGSGLYFVSDGQDLSTADLILAVAVALKRPARLLTVPPRLLELAGRIGDGIASLTPWPFTSSAVHRLQDSLTVDITRIRTDLGYQPRFSLEQGLDVTAQWFRGRESSA